MARYHPRWTSKMLALIFPWHVRHAEQMDMRIRAARAEVDIAQNRLAKSTAEAAKAQAYRQENRFAAMIMDSLGIGHNH
jgi:predicted glycoside hydrolase/deacetylase ChbG (UPF0249 family)